MPEFAKKEALLEKRGWAKSWGEIYVELTDGVDLTWYEVKSKQKHGAFKDRLKVLNAQKLASKKKGEDFAFELHLKHLKGSTDRWVVRASSETERESWVSTIKENLKQMGGEAYNYGLPKNDPRTDLPLVLVPPEHETVFGYLNQAVIHWFGAVKKLGVGFAVEERIMVLGDRCLYLCKKNADITRCIVISDIKKLLLAQDDSKDLYIAVVMPPEVTSKPAQGEEQKNVEYDIMFHSPDIQTFVRYLRTVYVYVTQGKMLPLEQVQDKAQLTTDVRLTRPKHWHLNYWQPTFKEQLAKVLNQWYANEEAKKKSAAAPASPLLTAAPAAAEAAPAAAPKTAAPVPPAAESKEIKVDESDPLGKFLVCIKLPKYYDCLVQKKMTLELMATGGLIDDSDLYHFGVEDEADRETIMTALQDEPLVEKLMKGDVVTDYKPKAAAERKAQLNSDFEAAQPKLAADDDLDLDLDLDDEAPAGGAGFGGLGGGDDLDLDLDLDDFGVMDVPAGGGPNLDDLDDLDLDLGDLDASPGAGAGAGGDVDLDDLDDL